MQTPSSGASTQFPGWTAYRPDDDSTVVGTLLVAEPMDVPELGRRVELLAWVPPNHSSGRRYPVLYMHDGSNLFDEVTSNTGEWRVDETMTEFGFEAIVIGIPNAGDRRHVEYCPWPSHLGADVLGSAYAAFVVNRVKPFVEESLPAKRGREAAGVMGSSLGGLISLYLWLEYPGEFGIVGSMSTAAWFTPDVWAYLEEQQPPRSRIYVDVGTNEIVDDPAASAAYLADYHRLVGWLRSRGFDDELLLAVEEEGAIHIESAWARRLPRALQFLLRDAGPTAPTSDGVG